MPANRGEQNLKTNTTIRPEAKGIAKFNSENRAASATRSGVPRGRSRRRREIPHSPSDTFSGCDPLTLHRNITNIARNALPPPFQNGFYHVPCTTTDTIDPRLCPDSRKWTYAENVLSEDHCWTNSCQELRYEPCIAEDVHEQRKRPRSRGNVDLDSAWEEEDESCDIQWESADRTLRPVGEASRKTPGGSAHPILEVHHYPDSDDVVKRPRAFPLPLPAQAVTVPDIPKTVRQEEEEEGGEEGGGEEEEEEEAEEKLGPPPKRRKTTNTDPPSQPPANAIYQPGTVPIPPNILSIVTQIKSLPRKRRLPSNNSNNNNNINKNNNQVAVGKRDASSSSSKGRSEGGGGAGRPGYPMRTKLRSIPGMNSRNGYISKSSPLMPWYGDTRLFTEKWWKWLYVGGKARRELEEEEGWFQI